MSQLLKVGELAKSTGLTVRTLHHYDEIGLVKPSARSEAGYRLYDTGDVARLHAVQALRHLGLPLADIGPLLDGQGAAPEAILAQQIQALDEQVKQAAELRDRLALLRDGILRGDAPGLEDWIGSLSLMATYGRYFRAGELRQIFSAWDSVAGEYEQMKTEARAAMAQRWPPQDPRMQLFARRWMALMVRVMEGDFERMARWGELFRRERSAHGKFGAPPSDMIDFIEEAVQYRLKLLLAHFREEDLPRMRWSADTEPRLQAIEEEGRALMAAGEAPSGRQARALRARWEAVLDEVAGGDAELRHKLLTMHQADPLLLVGTPLSREVRAWLLEAEPGA